MHSRHSDNLQETMILKIKLTLLILFIDCFSILSTDSAVMAANTVVFWKYMVLASI